MAHVHAGFVGAEALLGAEVRYVDEAGAAVVTTLGELAVERVSKALPVRRIPSHAGQRHRPGLFWSATTGGHVPYESRLELDRLWLADFDPDVVWIAAQPMWLRGRDGDRVRRHAPDLLLSLKSGRSLLVDVKPRQFADLPDVKAVFDWTQRLCAVMGWSYQVWSGESPVLLANIRSLGLGRRAHDVPAGALALAQAAGGCDTTVGAIIDAVEQSFLGCGRIAVLALLWQGHWTVDLAVPLTTSSPITAGKDQTCPARSSCR